MMMGSSRAAVKKIITEHGERFLLAFVESMNSAKRSSL
jgi:hypothetical protein